MLSYSVHVAMSSFLCMLQYCLCMLPCYRILCMLSCYRMFCLVPCYLNLFLLQAVLALFEKGCPFNRKIINIHNGEQRTPEYMKMNPQGLVPLLKDGEKIVVESEKIIDYVDDQVKSGKIYLFTLWKRL